MSCPLELLKNGWNFMICCIIFKHVVVDGLPKVKHPMLTNVTSLEKQTAEDPRIAHGDDAVDGEFPYLVVIFLGGSENLEDRLYHHASGTIITVSHVLTACHLLTQHATDDAFEIDVNNLINASVVEVLAGTVDLNNGDGKGVLRRVKRLMVHPLCYRSEVSLEYDLGMMLLKRPFKIVPGRIEPLQFPKYKCTALVNELVSKSSLCETMGWGANRIYPHEDNFLKKIKAQLKPFDWCSVKITFITRRHRMESDKFNDLAQVCAIGVKNGATICGGDSGGPLMCQGGKTLVGIVSYGPGMNSCGKDKWPGVFARVDVAQDFIRKFVKSTTLRYKNFLSRCQPFEPRSGGSVPILHTSTAVIMTALIVIEKTIGLSTWYE